MNTKDFIRELTNVEEKYKNKPTLTFEVNISSMARDCRKHIEFLNGQIEKMKCCENCAKIETCKLFAHIDINICENWKLAE